MSVETSGMTDNGRIVVPAAIRRAADIRPKEALIFQVVDGGILIQTRRQAIERAQAVVKRLLGPGRSPAAELIAERRLEAKREERGG
jgi:AbrB family looped-hinge helix DNA binding protein